MSLGCESCVCALCVCDDVDNQDVADSEWLS